MELPRVTEVNMEIALGGVQTKILSREVFGVSHVHKVYVKSHSEFGLSSARDGNNVFSFFVWISFSFCLSLFFSFFLSLRQLVCLDPQEFYASITEVSIPVSQPIHPIFGKTRQIHNTTTMGKLGITNFRIFILMVMAKRSS